MQSRAPCKQPPRRALTPARIYFGKLAVLHKRIVSVLPDRRDDIHLSGPAHELIGKEAARLVQANETINSDARQARLQSPTDEKKKDKKGAIFELKFPPGY